MIGRIDPEYDLIESKIFANVLGLLYLHRCSLTVYPQIVF
jgi:hypothetical protein